MTTQVDQFDLKTLSKVIFQNPKHRIINIEAIAMDSGLLCRALFNDREIGVGLHPEYISLRRKGDLRLSIKQLNIVFLEMFELNVIKNLQEGKMINPFFLCDFNKEIQRATLKYHLSDWFCRNNK